MHTQIPEYCSNPDWNWGEIYHAQVLETSTLFGPVIHLKVGRHDGGDGIGWDELQYIKRELIGDVFAVELYPQDDNVVNEACLRHLWVVPCELLPFGLHYNRSRLQQ